MTNTKFELFATATRRYDTILREELPAFLEAQGCEKRFVDRLRNRGPLDPTWQYTQKTRLLRQLERLSDELLDTLPYESFEPLDEAIKAVAEIADGGFVTPILEIMESDNTTYSGDGFMERYRSLDRRTAKDWFDLACRDLDNLSQLLRGTTTEGANQ